MPSVRDQPDSPTSAIGERRLIRSVIEKLRPGAARSGRSRSIARTHRALGTLAGVIHYTSGQRRGSESAGWPRSALRRAARPRQPQVWSARRTAFEPDACPCGRSTGWAYAPRSPRRTPGKVEVKTPLHLARRARRDPGRVRHRGRADAGDARGRRQPGQACDVLRNPDGKPHPLEAAGYTGAEIARATGPRSAPSPARPRRTFGIRRKGRRPWQGIWGKWRG